MSEQTEIAIPDSGGTTRSGSIATKVGRLRLAPATTPRIARMAMITLSWSSSSQNPPIHVGSGGSALAVTASVNEASATTRRTRARVILPRLYDVLPDG